MVASKPESDETSLQNFGPLALWPGRNYRLPAFKQFRSPTQKGESQEAG